MKRAQNDPEQEGRTYRSFLNALRRLGYEVEDRDLRACDYGAGTTRTHAKSVGANSSACEIGPKRG